jgi:hypothetical protein
VEDTRTDLGGRAMKRTSLPLRTRRESLFVENHEYFFNSIDPPRT